MNEVWMIEKRIGIENLLVEESELKGAKLSDICLERNFGKYTRRFPLLIN